ncbi:hypothetical protein FOA52_000252 [Chlamydomonas sp. UWO 241]|nr:hypothetical protein FOA52_000252 [Chlamydomonas sp. UWO 241]
MHSLRAASGQCAGVSGRSMRVGASTAAPCMAVRRLSSLAEHGRRRALVCVAAAKKNYYEVLNVPQTANAKDVKAAYRRAALKLHPDVNKAADAKERFQEAKAAFETLTDVKARAEYDRRLRMGFTDSSSWGSGSSSSSGFSSSSYGRRAAPQPEDNYSFDDLMKDLDKEFSSWGKEREEKRGKKGGGSGKPASLWEELSAIGEEFVEFLEDELGVKEGEEGKATANAGQGKTKATASASSSGAKSGSSSRGTQTDGTGSGYTYTDYTATDWYKYEAEAPPPSPPPPPKKSREDEIEDELAALKKKLGR